MYVIDRFEGETALLEKNRAITEVPRYLLPKNAKEGDCLTFDGERYLLDEAETEARQKRIRKKMDALWK